MSTKAFLFPGQGAQKPGMGQALYNNFTEAKRAFERASDILGQDMRKLCFDTDEQTLSRTENAQTALFLVSMATLEVLASLGATPDAVAGFSLGECSAVAAAGCVSFEDGLRLVQTRADAMQKAAQERPGGMAAVLGLDFDAVAGLCAKTDGFVRAVNDNCPGQVVIAGEPDALSAASEACRASGAKRVVALNLSAAFHTEHMQPAAQTLRAFAESLSVSAPKHPLYTNVTGRQWNGEPSLPVLLSQAVQSPVLFLSCVRSLLASGVTSFVEVGAGKTLSGFVRRINREAAVCSTDTVEDIKELLTVINP